MQEVNHNRVRVLFIENRRDKRSEVDSTREKYGKMEVQELKYVLTARSSLADCTNIIEARQKMGGGELKTSNKGQWKRRAKQQVTDFFFSDGKTQEEVG